MSPQRVHLAGNSAPEGSVDVGGGSRWANPFKFSEISCAYPSLNEHQVHGMAVNQFRDLISAGHDFNLSVRQWDGSRRQTTYSYWSTEAIRSELAGKDLACTCPLELPCHADVLLEEANALDAELERLCEVMHAAYEQAAIGAGWETQKASRKPWSDVPEANKATMRVAVQALLDAVAAR